MKYDYIDLFLGVGIMSVGIITFIADDRDGILALGVIALVFYFFALSLKSEEK